MYFTGYTMQIVYLCWLLPV